MASGGYKTGNSHGERRVSTVDDALAGLATRQRGLVSARQIRDLGLSEDAIRYRVRIGRLHRLDRGVYAVGHLAAIPDARWMTALLRIGPEAVLSHRTAAAQWNLRRSASPLIEVTYPRRHRPLPGVRFHRAVLPEDEVTVHDGLPVTTVPRTLFDLASVLSEGELEVAIGEAEGMRRTDPLSLPDLIARHPGRTGVGRLRRVLARLGDPLIVRSELERRFLSLIAQHDLPRPQTNVLIEAAGHRYECDCVWPDSRLIVELDGRTSHERRAALDADRLRDRRLSVAGWTVIRITWAQLRDGPASVLADLGSLI